MPIAAVCARLQSRNMRKISGLRSEKEHRIMSVAGEVLGGGGCFLLPGGGGGC